MAEQAGLRVERIDLRSPNDLDGALAAADTDGAEALYDLQNPLLIPARDRFAKLALQYHLPTMAAGRDYVASGLLMSYVADFPATQRQAAVYVDKILKGARPGELPVEQPARFDCFVNVTTLRTLGLTVPPSVAPLVTEWIE